MRPIVYNVSLGVGLAAIFAGGWLTSGLGPSLLATGFLVIGLTLAGARG